MIRRPPRSTLLSLHDALPICAVSCAVSLMEAGVGVFIVGVSTSHFSGGLVVHTVWRSGSCDFRVTSSVEWARTNDACMMASEACWAKGFRRGRASPSIAVRR